MPFISILEITPNFGMLLGLGWAHHLKICERCIFFLNEYEGFRIIKAINLIHCLASKSSVPFQNVSLNTFNHSVSVRALFPIWILGRSGVAKMQPADQIQPTKRFSPVPSGSLSPTSAVGSLGYVMCSYFCSPQAHSGARAVQQLDLLPSSGGSFQLLLLVCTMAGLGRAA